MGHFHVMGELTGPTGRSVQLFAENLELGPTRMCPVQIAGGVRALWPVSEVRLRLTDVEVTTPCLIGPGGTPLLGVVALESLLLAVDPVGRRLVPIDAFAMDLIRERENVIERKRGQVKPVSARAARAGLLRPSRREKTV